MVKMKRLSAVAGSAAFFIVAPTIVAGVIPWLIAGRYSDPLTSINVFAALGVLLVVLGLAILLPAFAGFALEGQGTPAPVAPTERLVIGGVYRYVRNPMYLAVVGIILGQALLFASWGLVAYAVLIATATSAFVRVYEEPALDRRFGPQYALYRGAVPGWLPRLTPWRGNLDEARQPAHGGVDRASAD